MTLANEKGITSEELVRELRAYIDWAVLKNNGVTKANKPGHRLPFHWPPHPVSYSFHVLASDWNSKTEFTADDGVIYEVEVAKTPYGVFGRAPALWHEARGETLAEMLINLKDAAQPLFRRQRCISDCLDLPKRCEGHIAELGALDTLKLLYCKDRDVANDARIQIETRASLHIFGPTLIEILKDRRHPDRRTAQWCVLDLFEDITSYFPTEQERKPAIEAMRGLLWDAEDDYARTVYKAGVVLGGHIPETAGGEALLECLNAPSRIGRRSAIHGLFHVVEWFPETLPRILQALDRVAENDPEPLLRKYADHMAADIRQGNSDHVTEPVFEGE